MESLSTTLGVAILPAMLWRFVSAIFSSLRSRSNFAGSCAASLSDSYYSSDAEARQRLPEAQRRRVMQAEESNAKERQEEENRATSARHQRDGEVEAHRDADADAGG